jgi:hypothetical protein
LTLSRTVFQDVLVGAHYLSDHIIRDKEDEYIVCPITEEERNGSEAAAERADIGSMEM